MIKKILLIVTMSSHVAPVQSVKHAHKRPEADQVIPTEAGLTKWCKRVLDRYLGLKNAHKYLKENKDIMIKTFDDKSKELEDLKIDIIKILETRNIINEEEACKEIKIIKNNIGFKREKNSIFQTPTITPALPKPPMPEKPSIYEPSSFLPETPPPSPSSGCKRPRTPDIFLSLDK